MKQFITALILSALMATTAQAQDTEWCDGIYDDAETIMKGRQMGLDIRDMIKQAGDRQLYVDMIKLAYKQPKYSSETMRENVINEFTEGFYMACLDTTSD